ncbi:hypothetical protein K353_02797 [Kitasatospora sp. SolWspMP-SS2h]|nr:hypothetical protein K353_02797 [Kitasatospora sp. SolWspMP-SS2h]
MRQQAGFVLTVTSNSVALWMLTAFVVTFVVTRVVTRLIRSGRGPFRDVRVGGTHVHHAVFGIMAVLVAGALEFCYRPHSPLAQVLGALFGAGAALTLDEFALWLHLEDVYWAQEGRKSVDAVFIAVAVGVLLIGDSPFTPDKDESPAAFAVVRGVQVLLSLGAILKGKTALGVIGLFVPLVALVAVGRLAKPTSPWARWRYPPDSRKAARSLARFPPGRRTRMDAVKDFLGGTPHS